MAAATVGDPYGLMAECPASAHLPPPADCHVQIGQQFHEREGHDPAAADSCCGGVMCSAWLSLRALAPDYRQSSHHVPDDPVSFELEKLSADLERPPRS
ncbi:hypothetical protein [Nitratireductor basaltis]|uniref:hypothetical protein n=1 Tax=Nitratireductor basaltis TaxID=472175 RepID=UPI000AEF4F16|nr:hypothetical protein [Nitratireductor basaltis]